MRKRNCAFELKIEELHDVEFTLSPDRIAAEPIAPDRW